MGHKYQIFYPGKYLEWEKDLIEERIAIAKGEIPPKRPEGMPGRGAMPNVAVEYELLKYNRTWDPYNPLFNDKKYAQEAGYPDVPAWPCFKGPMAGVMLSIPKDIADTFYYANDGTDMQFFTPIFPGDTFTSEVENIFFQELTVPGSDLRLFRMGSTARMYNQRGELVVRSTGSVREGYRKIVDGSPKPSFSENMSEWVKYFPPAHYTTDEEWEYIKQLWDKEYIRGKNTLYWEDVKIGDEPAWTCSGPITHMDMIGWYGGNYMPMRDQIKKGTRTLFRDQYGQYLFETSIHFGGRNIPGARMVFFNDTACKHIVRMVTNYIGDAGFVTRVCWRFKQLFKEMWEDRPGGEILDKVPYMKGKGCTRHGAEGDTVIAKGYVTDKYINERGEHIIDLACWAETLDSEIVQVVAASARLPSRQSKGS